MNNGLLITGTYGVGKTTAHTELKKHTLTAYHAEDGARIHIAKSGIRVDSMTHVQKEHMQRQTNAYYVGAEAIASTLKRPFISDGSLVEAYIYSKHVLPKEECDDLLPYLEQYKYKYIACVIPPTVPLVDDGLRHVDKEFRLHIHNSIMQLLSRMGIPYEYIVSQDVDGRVQELKTLLGGVD